jgi:histidinol dehydrogenase
MSEIRVIDLTGKVIQESEVLKLIPRASLDIESVSSDVFGIIEKVRSEGSVAVSQLALEIDGFDSGSIRVQADELSAAAESLSSELRDSLELAIERVSVVSRSTMPKDLAIELSSGAVVRQRFVPVDSVGLYAPGGKAVYPSSVVMNAVPALVAGVPDISLASPGQREFGGRPHPTVLATASMLGISNVYCMGGPAAVAAFAFGLGDIGLAPVRMVTGPGNIYVAAAKRLLRGQIGIDSEAGTTEIMIIADESANPEFVAADLISQAEHDEAAASVLVTTSKALLEAVLGEISKQLATTAHRGRVLSALSGKQSALILLDSMEQAAEIANGYATEHLSLQVSDPEGLLKAIRNAGAVFLGDYSPVSLGDYMAGSNHVLPTGGTAKFSSGLGVHTFLRPQQVIDYSKTGLEGVRHQLIRLAEAESLPAHGDAVAKRFD